MGSRRSTILGLSALLLAGYGCAQNPPAPPLPAQSGAGGAKPSLVFGRLQFVENREETKWGVLFDRPTPELYHVQTERFINRIALTGGAFTEAFERDGSFCWPLVIPR